MAFDARRLVENAPRLPAEAEQAVGDDDAGGQRRGARAEPLAEGMSLWISSSIGGMVPWTSAATRRAVCQIRLSAVTGIDAASRPDA